MRRHRARPTPRRPEGGAGSQLSTETGRPHRSEPGTLEQAWALRDTVQQLTGYPATALLDLHRQDRWPPAQQPARCRTGDRQSRSRAGTILSG